MNAQADEHVDPTLDLQLSNTDYTADVANYDWLSQEWDWLRSPADDATAVINAADQVSTDPATEANADLEGRKQTFWQRW